MLSLLSVLYISLCEIFSLLGILIIFGFILGALKKYTLSFLNPIFGNKLILFTGFIGTPIHELGHAIMCIIFRHKIKRIKLFSFNSNDNVLGYVENTYDKMSIYQRIGNLFIAIGPLFSGIFALYFAFCAFFPNSYNIFFNSSLYSSYDNNSFIFDSNHLKWLMTFLTDFTKIIFSSFPSFSFWLFLLFAFSVSIHMTLSKADMNGFWDGLIFFSIAILIINIILSFIGVDFTNFFKFILFINSTILSFLSMALAFSLTFLILSFALYKIFK